MCGGTVRIQGGGDQPLARPEGAPLARSSYGRWHLVLSHWLPQRQRARPSAALDDASTLPKQTRPCQSGLPNRFEERRIILGQTGSVTRDWLSRRVLHYAHQGGAREAPSSTIFAFRRAVQHGADALEMDVHRTADGYLVVAHDGTIDRTTPASGSIDQLTLNELRSLDFAHWWSPGHDAVTDLPDHHYPLRGRAPADPSLGVTLLSEVLDAFANTLLNFDIKGGAVPYEQELADTLRAYGRSDDVIVASFHDDHLQQFRAIAPEICTSSALQESYAIAQALIERAAIDLPLSLVALQVPYRFSAETDPLFDASLVDAAHDRGLAVHVWTIDDEAEMDAVISTGADGIMTDFPSRLESVMARRGVSRWR